MRWIRTKGSPSLLAPSPLPRVSQLDLISPASKRDCWTPIITDPVLPQWPLVFSLSSRDLTGSPCRVTEQRRFNRPIGSCAIVDTIIVICNKITSITWSSTLIFVSVEENREKVRRIEEIFPNKLNFSPDFGVYEGNGERSRRIFLC